MSVYRQSLACLLLAFPAIAQSQEFATITIRPAAEPGNRRMQILPNGDLMASATPLVSLVAFAYDVPVQSPRLSGLPGWAIRDRYDIEAKAPADAVPPSFQGSDVRSRIEPRLRALLIDRFGFQMRVENRMMPVYALRVARGGPKLEKSAIAEEDCTFDTDPWVCHQFVGGIGHPLIGDAVSMDDIVRYIENWTDLPVVNRTALSGLFTVNTEGWVPMRLPPPPPGNTPAANPFAGLPTIFMVLDELGLELVRQEETLPVYTVEHVERPAERSGRSSRSYTGE